MEWKGNLSNWQDVASTMKKKTSSINTQIENRQVENYKS